MVLPSSRNRWRHDRMVKYVDASPFAHRRAATPQRSVGFYAQGHGVSNRNPPKTLSFHACVNHRFEESSANFLNCQLTVPM